MTEATSQWNKAYHWKTKGCTPWAKQYFHDRLVGRTGTPGGGEVTIDALKDWDGDVELGNRKGKLITIYDCSFALEWSGKASDESEVKGKIVFPEVSHEIEDNEEEYRFETELVTGSGNASSMLYSSLRSDFAPSLIPVLKAFRDTLIASHAADLGHEDQAAAAAAGAMAAPKNKPPPMKTDAEEKDAAAAVAAAAGAGAETEEEKRKKAEEEVSRRAARKRGKKPKAKPASAPEATSATGWLAVASAVALAAGLAWYLGAE